MPIKTNSVPSYELSLLAELWPEGPAIYQTGEVDSVLNTALAESLTDRLQPWSSILARSQTQGRGSWGRTWASPPGHVYAAVRLPRKPPFQGPGAPAALGLLLAESLRSLGIRDIRLKWPNDLLVSGGKAGGILLEDRRNILLAGIGLNLGQTPFPAAQRDPRAPPPAAFPEHLGPPEHFWPQLAKSLVLGYNKFFPEGDPEWARTFVTLAEKNLAGLGQLVSIERPLTDPRTSSPILTGLLIGLAPGGALLTEGPNGAVSVWSGTLILPNHIYKNCPDD
jgi:BirA family biotin operon repressor/biotin-[acetyl-CoA-carboxylase] ligase